MEFALSQGVVLPDSAAGGTWCRPDQAGTWHALLTIGNPQISRPDAPPVVRGRSPFQRLQPRSSPAARRCRAGWKAIKWRKHFSGRRQFAANRAPPRCPFSLLVHTYSNLSLRASLNQSGFEVGARVSLRASLSESGIPMLAETAVWAEITRPDGWIGDIGVDVEGDGQFAGTFATSA